MEIGLSEDSQSLEQLKLLKEITVITRDQHSVLSPLHPPSPLSRSPAELIVGQAAERQLGESGFRVTVTYGRRAQRVTSLPACGTIRLVAVFPPKATESALCLVSNAVIDTPYLHLFVCILIRTSSFT